MRGGDTIVALSSGALPSGVAVIRFSGPEAGALLQAFIGPLPAPRQLALRAISVDGKAVDRGLAAWFPGPQSFTGEDCAELQLHGSRAVVRAVLRAATEHGARLAEAGEFTRRAFENGKLDLTEVEGLGDLIDAETENQRALAYARMDGGLARRVEGWREKLLDLRAQIEAQLDFSDEGDVGALPPMFFEEVAALRDEIAALMASESQGRIVRSGFRVVLAGPPNAGKSSLLNALSQSEVAIVSDEPGTTRDLKEVPIDLQGQLVILIDSAGLRETESKAEAIGVARARTAIEGADLVLWLVAADQGGDGFDAPQLRAPVLRLGTKSDIGVVSGVDHSVSAATGDGLLQLLDMLHGASGAREAGSGDLLVSRERDRVALAGALATLNECRDHTDEPEIAAEDLRQASAALERLLGVMDAESVLDRLFLSFCIGK